MAGPLSHVRVLDLSRILAGPWAGQILADLGADVVKVERAGAGDDTRTWGPPFLKDRDGRETRESGYYLAVNRGKRSIALDLDKPEGQAIVKALAARSDIVLENFKVGTLKKFGLDYEGLKAVNPRIIYCSITGFGQTGPKRDHPAYDFMIQGMGGLMSITGEPDGKPQKVGVPITDLMTGMYATIAVLAGLARRAETGRGDYIDLAMLDVQVGYLCNQAMNFMLTGRSPHRTGNAHPNIQPQNVFAVADGHIVIAAGNDGQFAKLAEVIGEPQLAADARFATNKARVTNLPALYAIIEPILASRPLAHWIAAFDNAGVPAGPINTVPMVFDEPQVQHRQMRIEIPHPVSGTVPQVASPMKFSEAALTFERPPPLLGQHTEEILREIGWSG
jgi:crotonobetainyl-CoA:carnitine CoA-transferase CaiB-like acyl-CoA transferase